jgi:hypothetical protein
MVDTEPLNEQPPVGGTGFAAAPPPGGAAAPAAPGAAPNAAFAAPAPTAAPSPAPALGRTPAQRRITIAALIVAAVIVLGGIFGSGLVVGFVLNYGHTSQVQILPNGSQFAPGRERDHAPFRYRNGGSTPVPTISPRARTGGSTG